MARPIALATKSRGAVTDSSLSNKLVINCMPRIAAIERKKLENKIASVLNEQDPNKKQTKIATANTYSKLLLRRHGVSEKTHHIVLQDGRIVENELKGEDKVQAEIEQHL